MFFRQKSRSDSLSSLSLVHLIANEDWEMAKMEARANPKEVKIASKLIGFFEGVHDSCVLPLHQACALQPPADVVELLCQIYSLGLGIAEPTFDRLPLHVACQTMGSTSFEVIQILLDWNPEAAKHKDKFGRLPIHYACSHGASSDVVALLLQAFPASASVCDKNGWLPIHVACRYGDDKEVVCQLLKAWPDSLDVPTRGGNTPLSCAKKVHDDRHEILVHFLERMSTTFENDRGRTPTTLAA